MTPLDSDQNPRRDPRCHMASLLSNIFLVALFSFILFPLWYIAYEKTSPASASAFAAMPENGFVQVPDQTKSISLLFMGDMMFDRGVRTKILAAGEEIVFASTTRYSTEQYDLAIANLEGPITSNKSKTVDGTGKAIPGFTFTFPTSTAPLLKNSGIDIVSLANNHADNFGPSGFRETAKRLRESGVEFFGNANNDPSDSNPSPISTIHCSANICIGFIGYHGLIEGGQMEILSKIKDMVAMKAAGELDSIIVFPHWGNEYEKRPSASQKKLAHDWINAGADMVIGAHPHIVQSMEIYDGKPIFYSLGNYIFDQYFSYDTTHSIAIGLNFEKKNPEGDLLLKKIKLIPLDLTGTTVKIANDIDRAKMLAEIVKISDGFIATSTKERILAGEISF